MFYRLGRKSEKPQSGGGGGQPFPLPLVRLRVKTQYVEVAVTHDKQGLQSNVLQLVQDFFLQGSICYPPRPGAILRFGSLQLGFLGWLCVRKHILKDYRRELITVSILVSFISLLTAVRIHLNVGRSSAFSDQHSDIIENLENRIIRIIVALQIALIFYFTLGDLPSHLKKM